VERLDHGVGAWPRFPAPASRPARRQGVREDGIRARSQGRGGPAASWSRTALCRRRRHVESGQARDLVAGPFQAGEETPRRQAPEKDDATPTATALVRCGRPTRALSQEASRNGEHRSRVRVPAPGVNAPWPPGARRECPARLRVMSLAGPAAVLGAVFRAAARRAMTAIGGPLREDFEAEAFIACVLSSGDAYALFRQRVRPRADLRTAALRGTDPRAAAIPRVLALLACRGRGLLQGVLWRARPAVPPLPCAPPVPAAAAPGRGDGAALPGGVRAGLWLPAKGDRGGLSLQLMLTLVGLKSWRPPPPSAPAAAGACSARPADRRHARRAVVPRRPRAVSRRRSRSPRVRAGRHGGAVRVGRARALRRAVDDHEMTGGYTLVPR